mgnify:CR=1 FL=1
MPAVEANLARFRAADTQVLGVSVDSIHSHIAWGDDLGGVSFPLLADFEPKGAVAKSFGHYLDGPGIGDRATVIIDKEGVVRHSESVTPAGKREVDDLVAACEKINGGASGSPTAAPGVGNDTTLFIKSACGLSRRVLRGARNLHLELATKNVSDDPAAMAELKSCSGAETAPCLVLDGKAMGESSDILIALANRAAPLLG